MVNIVGPVFPCVSAAATAVFAADSHVSAKPVSKRALTGGAATSLPATLSGFFIAVAN